MTGAWSIMMTRAIENFHDMVVKHCDDKVLVIVITNPWSLVMTSLMEHTDEKGHGTLRIQGSWNIVMTRPWNIVMAGVMEHCYD